MTSGPLQITRLVGVLSPPRRQRFLDVTVVVNPCLVAMTGGSNESNGLLCGVHAVSRTSPKNQALALTALSPPLGLVLHHWATAPQD